MNRYTRYILTICLAAFCLTPTIAQGEVTAALTDTITIESTTPATEPTSESQEVALPIALHTNLLFDAITIPNIGVEVMLPKGLSLATNWHYAWWQNEGKNWHWKTYGGYLALRYRFHKDAGNVEYAGTPFSGHHIGLYSQILLYNFECGGTGYMSGDGSKNIFHNPTFGFGIEYGYTLPLSRRLSLDFTLGLGYMQGRYYEYKPKDSHFVWQATKNRHYFGPTKLEVNLVWLLGKGNVNKRGGGHEK